MGMAKVEILKGEVPGLVLGAAPLTAPGAHVCAKGHSNEAAFQKLIMITHFISYLKNRCTHYSKS